MHLFRPNYWVIHTQAAKLNVGRWLPSSGASGATFRRALGLPQTDSLSIPSLWLVRRSEQKSPRASPNLHAQTSSNKVSARPGRPPASWVPPPRNAPTVSRPLGVKTTGRTADRRPGPPSRARHATGTRVPSRPLRPHKRAHA